MKAAGESIMRQRAMKVIDDGAPLLARLATLFRKPQNRVIRCEVRSVFIAPTPAAHIIHKPAVAPCLGMLPFPVLESVSQCSRQRHFFVALDVFPIADSALREEKALIDSHVRVPKQIGQTTYISTRATAEANSSANKKLCLCSVAESANKQDFQSRFPVR